MMESVMVMVTVAEVMSGGSVKKGKSVHPKTNPDWLMVKTWMSSSQIKHALSLSLSNKPGSYEQLFIFFAKSVEGLVRYPISSDILFTRSFIKGCLCLLTQHMTHMCTTWLSFQQRARLWDLIQCCGVFFCFRVQLQL